MYLALFSILLVVLAIVFLFQKKWLENAFKSLSLEILEKNSRIFLDFAKVSLEKYQDGAKHDLESRQKAIGETLKPFYESLKSLDHHQRELEKEERGLMLLYPSK